MFDISAGRVCRRQGPDCHRNCRTAGYDAAKLDLTTHASQATPARTSRSLELFSMWSSERSRSCGGNIETRKTSFLGSSVEEGDVSPRARA